MERLTRRDYKHVFCEYDSMKCADQEEDGGCQYCEHMMQMMKKLAHYEDLEEQLVSVYGECDGLLEKVVEGLVKHEGAEFEKPMKARLLTDEDVDKWDRLKGAMERIVERLEECSAEEVDLWANDNEDWDEDGNLKIRKITQIHGYAIDCYQKAIEIVKEEM